MHISNQAYYGFDDNTTQIHDVEKGTESETHVIKKKNLQCKQNYRINVQNPYKKK